MLTRDQSDILLAIEWYYSRPISRLLHTRLRPNVRVEPLLTSHKYLHILHARYAHQEQETQMSLVSVRR